MSRESTKVEPVLFQVKEIADEIKHLFESHLIAKNITFDIKLNEQQIFGDKEMIKMVVRNLVANAIKFTPKNGTISITAESQQDITSVTIKDSGVGMSLAASEKLFKLRSVASTKGTEKETGTGLGLMLCKEIMEKNRGTISVDSTEGKGSKFTFTLPSKILSPDQQQKPRRLL